MGGWVGGREGVGRGDIRLKWEMIETENVNKRRKDENDKTRTTRGREPYLVKL